MKQDAARKGRRIVEETKKTVRIQGEDLLLEDRCPVWVCCAEHLERALDDYVDQYEVAPDTYPLEQVEDPELAQSCKVCGAVGQVVLLRVKGM